MQDDAAPQPIVSRQLEQAGGNRIRHGFFTRQGGVSQGIYRGLNVGVGSQDRQDDVLENRARVARWFGLAPDRLATLHQIHSPDVVVVDGTYAGDRPKGDGMVSTTPGVILGVLSADCGPILFMDARNGVIGAAHAGWKGALDGVLESTIDAMVALGADRNGILASLGPSISRDSYEVGPEFVARFVERDPSYAAFFTPSQKPGHAMFDLQGLTVQRLRDAGVTAESLDLCTYPDADRFFSYRRTTHAGEPDYGRQISAIAIVEA